MLSTISWWLTGAGASPRGHSRLAAYPGDRILRSRIRIRSHIFGSNHFEFLSLCYPRRFRFRAFEPSALPRAVRRRLARQRPLNRQQGIYPTSPADRVLRLQLLRLLPPRLPLLPLRPSVTTRAFDNRRQSFSQFERVLSTPGDGGLDVKILGLFPNNFFW
jgi:hypothetical protein